MPTGFIDLNDSGIDLAIDGQVIATSPACAVLDSGQLLIGQPALESARLYPRWTNNCFWHQLNTDPIPNATQLKSYGFKMKMGASILAVAKEW